MAVDALRISVLFSAIDRLTGPMKGIAGGSSKVKAAIADAKREILALERAQGRTAAFRKAESNYRQLGDALKVARSEARAAKLELAAAEKPTAALARAAARAEAAEQKAGRAYQDAGAKVQKLGNELEAAGVDITRLVAHEDRLANSIYDANKRLDQQTDKLARNEKAQARAAKVREIGGTISGAGTGLSLGVTLPALAFAKTASDAANESRQAVAQVEASLASMGPKAGRTLEQLKGQAEKLQSTSLFDDDDIMRKLTANLLTFGKVQGPIFDRAQQAAVDLSAKLGQDLQSSAMQLGKALNDPAKGVTALQRVGVSFSAEQKKQIQNFQKTGQLAKAQAIILKELETQVGGSAAAARKADPMADSAENWRTFQENVGAIVNQLLPRLNALLSRALTWFNGLSPAMQETVVQGAAIAAAIGPALVVLGKLTTGAGYLLPVLGKLGPAFLTVGRLALRAGAMMLANPMILAIVAIVAAIAGAAYLIYKHWDKISAAFAAGVAKVSQIWARLKGAIAGGFAAFVGLHARFLQIGGQLVQGLINGVTGKLAALKKTIVGAASAAANWFKQKLGIRSPSRVFMAFGGHITDGLQRGIAAGEAGAVRRVDRLSTKLAGAFAATSLVAAPAIGAPGAVPGAPSGVAGRPAASSAAAAAPAPLGPIEIHIHQLPGQDAAELARALKAELEKLQGASNRSGYHDDDD